MIVLAAISLPMGFTSSKEYAELEWPIDILLAVVWISYGVVFFGTIVKRKAKHIYVANWFLGAFILVVAVLHIVNTATYLSNHVVCTQISQLHLLGLATGDRISGDITSDGLHQLKGIR